MAIRLAVLGLGRGAVLTVPALAAHPGLDLVAGADPDPAARAGLGLPGFASAAELFAWGEFDAVYIASPHEFHAEHAQLAARHGKHALVEKPMAVSLADAAAMARAAERAGTVLMIGPSHGYDPPVGLAAELIAGGELGKVRLIEARNFTDFLYRPRRPAELDTAQGGGVVLSQASHQIDLVRRLAQSPVVAVRAWTGGWDARASEGAYCAQLHFASGAAATLTYSGYARYDSDAQAGWIGEMGGVKDPAAHGRARAALAAADEQQAKAARTFAAGWPPAVPPAHHERFGTVLALCERADIELTPDGVVIHGDSGPRAVPAPVPPVQRLTVADRFVQAIQTGQTPLFGARWGLETLAICHALLASARDRRELNPADLIAGLP